MPANVAMTDTTWWREIAGLLLGYDKQKIFEMTDAELEATRPLVEKVVKNARFLWKDPTEINQALASGEIVAAYAWNETPKTLKSRASRPPMPCRRKASSPGSAA